MLANLWLGRRSWLVLCLAAGLAGCGGEPEVPGLVPVTGKVTLDGKPLDRAQVTFVPTGTDGRTAIASTDATGAFAMTTNNTKGAMPGSYRVAVSYIVGRDGQPITQFEEGMDITQLLAAGEAKEGLPPRYSDPQQTELKFDVAEGGENVCNLDLKSM